MRTARKNGSRKASLCRQEVWEWKEAGAVLQVRMQRAGQTEGLLTEAEGRRRAGIRLTDRLMETAEETTQAGRLMAEADTARRGRP